MITPAKWQAKGGPKNEAFRRDIVPYMSKIVYYPDSRDIFDIKMQGGVCYYAISKLSSKTVEVSNVCKKNKLLNSKQVRTFDGNLYNGVTSILARYKNILGNVCTNTEKIYGVFTINAYMNGAIMLESGNTLLFGKMRIQELKNPHIGDSEKMIFSSDNRDECNSFISFANSKLVRFIAFTLIDGQQPKFEMIWRFVPDPGAFDHIFTDDELYKKYNLTKDEIDLIESVIKERK